LNRKHKKFQIDSIENCFKKISNQTEKSTKISMNINNFIHS